MCTFFSLKDNSRKGFNIEEAKIKEKRSSQKAHFIIKSMSKKRESKNYKKYRIYYIKPGTLTKDYWSMHCMGDSSGVIF